LALDSRGWMLPSRSTRISDRNTASTSGVISTAPRVKLRMPVRNCSSDIPFSCGGASIVRAVRQSIRSRIDRKPPSTRAWPKTSRGRSTASWRATFAPQEWPTTTGRPNLTLRITAAASAVSRSNP